MRSVCGNMSCTLFWQPVSERSCCGSVSRSRVMARQPAIMNALVGGALGPLMMSVLTGDPSSLLVKPKSMLLEPPLLGRCILVGEERSLRVATGPPSTCGWASPGGGGGPPQAHPYSPLHLLAPW
jgi:hypothetical protein